MTIKIEVKETDFLEVASPQEAQKLFGSTRVLGGDEDSDKSPAQLIEELLPAALVERVKKMVPSDFELVEISMQAEVSGKVLGTGLSGTFSMKLGKKAQSTT